MSTPTRTCVGCRGRASKHELLRVVRRGDGPVADPRQVESGRGAYLHPVAGCLDAALKRRSLGRALRLPGQGPDPAAVRAALSPHLGSGG